MALHGEQGKFSDIMPSPSLSGSAILDALTAFKPII